VVSGFESHGAEVPNGSEMVDSWNFGAGRIITLASLLAKPIPENRHIPVSISLFIATAYMAFG
jgi:hypothetical protein